MSPSLLVAEVDQGGVVSERVLSLAGMHPRSLCGFVMSQGAKTLICGGIHERFQRELEINGVNVIWGVIGPYKKALDEYVRGTLTSDRFLCPGRKNRGGGGRRMGRKRGPDR